MSQFMILMQGAPGSGKSTTAHKIARLTGAEVLSTDDYWETQTGYVFSPDRLGVAHKWNQDRVREALKQGKSVIVDNTNIYRAHAEVYFFMAEKLGVPVEVIRCHGRYQNVHGVPEWKVREMESRMEDLF